MKAGTNKLSMYNISIQNKFKLFFILILTALVCGLLLWQVTKPTENNYYLDFIDFTNKFDTFSSYPHTIKGSKRGESVGAFYKFYIYSDTLPNNYPDEFENIHQYLYSKGWQTVVQGERPVLTFEDGAGKLKGAPGQITSSGSYTNQFKQGDTLLIVNIDAVIQSPSATQTSHDYLKVNNQFVWDISIITIQNYF